MEVRASYLPISRVPVALFSYSGAKIGVMAVVLISLSPSENSINQPAFFPEMFWTVDVLCQPHSFHFFSSK